MVNWGYGGIGNDFLYGSAGADVLVGDNYRKPENEAVANSEDEIGGNDLLKGYEGDDEIQGGDGNDILYGGEGDDELYGQMGDDRLYGEEGNDVIYGDGKYG